MTWKGTDITGWAPYRVARAGIGFVPEDRRIFAELTVWENLDVACKQRSRDPSQNRPPTPEPSNHAPLQWTVDRVFDLFPSCASYLHARAGISPAASSRCSPSPARSWATRSCSCSMSRRRAGAARRRPPARADRPAQAERPDDPARRAERRLLARRWPTASTCWRRARSGSAARLLACARTTPSGASSSRSSLRRRCPRISWRPPAPRALPLASTRHAAVRRKRRHVDSLLGYAGLDPSSGLLHRTVRRQHVVRGGARPVTARLIVLDCGSGAHDLGRQLVGHRAVPRAPADHAHALGSHPGLPVLRAPLRPRQRVGRLRPRQVGRRIEETLAGQMHYPYFPVPLETLAATIRYHELAEETLDLAGVRVTTRYLNHPAPAIGYRLQAGGVTLVYATDHEPHSRTIPRRRAGRGSRACIGRTSGTSSSSPTRTWSSTTRSTRWRSTRPS